MNVSRFSHAMLVLAGVVAGGYGCGAEAQKSAAPGQGGAPAIGQGGGPSENGGALSEGGSVAAGGSACVANGACVTGSANCQTAQGQNCLCSSVNSRWSCSAVPAGGSSQGGAASSTGGATATGTGGAIVFNCTANAACTPAGSSCMTTAGNTCTCSSVNNTWGCASVAATGGAPAVGACSSNTTKQNETSEKGKTISLGRYYVTNNQWGSASATSGSQSVWSTCNDGTNIGWGTSFTWNGGAGSVKSFASAVLGWHWGWVLPISTSYLPIQVGSTKALNCAWTYRVTRNGAVTMNVAYDLWVHSVALTGASNEWDTNTYPQYKPTDEIMIWLYAANGAAPAGSVVGNYTVAGTTWALWKGQILSNGALMWNVYSFVRTANADTGMTLNIQEFVTKLKDLGHLTTSKYLSSVQAGTEVFTGIGQVDTLNYSCSPN